MNRRASTALALLSLAAAPSACAEPPAPWRRVEVLEQFVVLTCQGDPGRSWVVRSREEERKLLTPAFHAACPSGAVRRLVWPCCDDEGYRVIRSRDRLEELLASTGTGRPGPGSASPRWKVEYLAEIDRAIPRLGKEVLVLLGVPYGGTGMAKASLDVRERGEVITALVRIDLPPPPLTPDTTVFRFALVVDAARVRELRLLTRPPGAASDGSDAPARTISLREGER